MLWVNTSRTSFILQRILSPVIHHKVILHDRPNERTAENWLNYMVYMLSVSICKYHVSMYQTELNRINVKFLWIDDVSLLLVSKLMKLIYFRMYLYVCLIKKCLLFGRNWCMQWWRISVLQCCLSVIWGVYQCTETIICPVFLSSFYTL